MPGVGGRKKIQKYIHLYYQESLQFLGELLVTWIYLLLIMKSINFVSVDNINLKRRTYNFVISSKILKILDDFRKKILRVVVMVLRPMMKIKVIRFPVHSE